VHFILIKPVSSDHLSYVTLFQCSFGRSHMTGLTVQYNRFIEVISKAGLTTYFRSLLFLTGEMGAARQYKNSCQAVTSILKTEGVRGIYTG
jgi:hypothetical protein